jgi:preprotein translocase subunit SecA
MDYLRQGIHLRGYAQKNPKQEYKREAFEMFRAMLASLKEEVVRTLSRMQVRSPEEVAPARQPDERFQFMHEAFSGLSAPEEPATAGTDGQLRPTGGQQAKPAARPHLRSASVQHDSGDDHQPYVRGERKVGRNEPCPCGSGKKYKQCHGKVA